MFCVVKFWDFKVILLTKMKIHKNNISCFLNNCQITLFVLDFLSTVSSTVLEREWLCTRNMTSYLNRQTHLSDPSNCYPFQIPNNVHYWYPNKKSKKLNRESHLNEEKRLLMIYFPNNTVISWDRYQSIT